MGRLEGKTAIITGAGSGIAKVATGIFIREGAKVMVAELNEAAGAATAAETGAVFQRTDVTDDASAAACAAAAMAEFGRIDILFNCAGGSVVEDTKIHEVDLEVWDRTIPLDLKGPMLMCRHVVPHMIAGGGGAVVNISSVVALRGNHPAHIYSAAKGGLISFTRSLAGSYSDEGVRANVICPGLILTERIRARYRQPNEERLREASVGVFEQYPFGVGEPQDIANIGLFLASDESRMVNGAVIPAEGGISAY
ncbi:MAG: SDR family oxidoreductase [Rhodospirillales bacterium]|nr:SDR family oxidoreductase [Rhodospirillales bacterium]